MILKIRRTLFFVGLIHIIVSCTTSHNSNGVVLDNGVVDINISEALKNPKGINLSSVVDDVEFITLESNPESFFRYTERTQITENFILIVGIRGLHEQRLLLFNRSGKFLRQIGHIGRGPGEYAFLKNASIDPKERYVIAVDGHKYLKYTLDGTFLKERKIPDGSRNGRVSAPLFLDYDHFAIANNRPKSPTDDFFKITVFDLELRKTNSLLKAPNNDSLCLWRMNLKLLSGSGEKLFFEGFINNLYALEVNQEPVLKYHLTIEKDSYTLEDMTGPLRMSNDGRRFHSVSNVTNLPKYLLFTTEHNTKDEAKLYQFIYDKEEKETSLLLNDFDCYNPVSKYDKLLYTFNNDLFGLPILLGHFPENTFSSLTMSLGSLSDWINLKRFRELDVLMPKKRDQLVDIVEGYTGEELPLLVLLHYK